MFNQKWWLWCDSSTYFVVAIVDYFRSRVKKLLDVTCNSYSNKQWYQYAVVGHPPPPPHPKCRSSVSTACIDTIWHDVAHQHYIKLDAQSLMKLKKCYMTDTLMGTCLPTLPSCWRSSIDGFLHILKGTCELLGCSNWQFGSILTWNLRTLWIVLILYKQGKDNIVNRSVQANLQNVWHVLKIPQAG